ncbi:MULTISPECIES: hypothetical protein [Capnocytophaga]|uniref:Uncharacterized protein n=1 Tax=Capnocytophaga stomatis TaxID=1848904 RepID=A0ABW8QAD4_9FLAO|nr:hypothetical protein [Capnocytophaga stomatis]GIJ93726.1 hypothetical protein CAPN002_09440 [Capnocytophaga stomatis]
MTVAIDKKVKTIIQDFESTEKDSKLKEYEETIKQFDELVKKGIAKKRENNLLSTVNIHTFSPVFINSAKKTSGVVTNF